MNTVANVTYKDNEHLAVKCIVLQSQGMDGAGRLFKRLLMTRSLQICGCFGMHCTFVVTMATSVYLQLIIQCDDEDDDGWREEALYVTPVSITEPSEGWRTLMIQCTHDVCEY